MQLTSNTPAVVPDGPDYVAVTLNVTPIFDTNGVSTLVAMQVIHYRQPDGGSPVKVGDAHFEQHNPVEADAAADPDLAAAVTAIATAIQTYVLAKGL